MNFLSGKGEGRSLISEAFGRTDELITWWLLVTCSSNPSYMYVCIYDKYTYGDNEVLYDMI